MKKKTRGFTLIEMSIVLIIIGLIVGGILVGRDLIGAAAVRAQIAQIDKYNQAVNSFKTKFGYLPGDLLYTAAAQYGFVVGSGCNGTSTGWRDGNGMVEGWTSPSVQIQGAGETALFWQDLSSPAAGKLIEGTFPNGGAATFGCVPGGADYVYGSSIGQIFPTGKIGGQFIYVLEANDANWYGLSAVTVSNSGGQLNSNATIPVMQAYNMDKKIDDGIPTTGDVQAIYINNNVQTAQTAPSAASDSATTCYNTNNQAYSITYNNGLGTNCAIAFRFPQ